MILADENIPLVRELFSEFGELKLLPGRNITRSLRELDRTEVLLIRSVTKVNEELIKAMPRLHIIGTATIGTDHIEIEAVRHIARKRGTDIHILSAPGSNADSVADYIFYALFHTTRGEGRPLIGRSIGIVGVGNCGSRVARRAEAIGMQLRLNDPPRALEEPSFRSLPLELVINSDFVTLHTPLTRPEESKFPTHHLIDRSTLSRMSSGTLLVNTSRGGVVSSEDLIESLRSRRIRGAVLDVFEGEPEPDPSLLGLATLVTPHIAGYAVEGKRRGAIMLYERMCHLLGVAQRVDTSQLLHKGLQGPHEQEVPFRCREDLELTAEEALRALLEKTHDIERWSRRLKSSASRPGRAVLFDQMRREYFRRELGSFSVGIRAEKALAEAIEQRLEGFGIELTNHRPCFWLLPIR